MENTVQIMYIFALGNTLFWNIQLKYMCLHLYRSLCYAIIQEQFYS